ncbi:MFS transporter [Lentzea sp. NPDC006480]|uniref:MFS transporter n=1 Tax=Lentzea sp. NPDC006480 TaxID=3157176 RepID=UPI0033A873D8
MDSLRDVSLLGNVDFRRFWGATSISALGDGVTSVAIPLTAIVVLHANAVEIGIVTALAWLPSLLFSVHLGSLVDRFGRRRAMMIVADVVRLILLIGLWISYTLGVLSFLQLFVASFLLGVFSVLFTVNENSLFVALVPSDRYVDGQALCEGGRSLAFLVGPAVGGMLVSMLSAPTALLADAASFLSSAFLLGRIKVNDPPRQEGRISVGEGLSYIGRTLAVRVLLLITATANLFNIMFTTMVMLYLVEQVRLSPVVIGVVIGLGEVGGFLGAATCSRLARRFGVGRTLLAGVLLSSLPLLAIPLTGVLAMILAASSAAGFGGVIRDICAGTLFSALVPDNLRSRVRGAFMAVSFGARPLGALLSGVLVTLIGLPSMLVVAAAGGAFATLWLVRSPRRLFSLTPAQD